jgi:hypothetical protein
MKISRRKFVVTLFFGMIGLVFLDAFWIEKYIVRWSKNDLSNGNKEPIKVVQLTDLHIREIKSYHSWIANRINKEQPDLLFFTGDTVDRPRQLPLLEAFLKRIDQNIPKVVIMGNKEYDGKVTPATYKELFKKYNGQLLINEGMVYTKGNRRINILGMDDLLNGGPDITLASAGFDASTETVILNHCPEYKDTIDRLNTNLNINIKLILSGHTHGGQIQIFGKAIFKPGGSGRYLAGWYKSKQSLMYVSKGLGTSYYLPIRFGARAEAPIFYL